MMLEKTKLLDSDAVKVCEREKVGGGGLSMRESRQCKRGEPALCCINRGLEGKVIAVCEETAAQCGLV